MDQDATWYRKVGPNPSDIAFDGTQLLPPKKESEPPISSHVYCAKTARWIKMPLGIVVGLDPSDIVLDRDPARPLQNGGRATPQFRPISIAAKRLHGSRCHLGGRSRPRPHCATWKSPQFSVHVYCAETAGWIKMPLSMEVGLDSTQAALY